MQNSVSNRQMTFLTFLVCTALSTTTISRAMALSAGRGAWLTLLITSVLFGGITVLILKLNQMYEGKVLFEYSGIIAGRVLPYILGVFYVLYFLIFDISIGNTLAQLVHTHFLIKTPEWALIFILVPVLGYIAYKGLNRAARLVEIFLIWFLIVSVVIFITMIFQGRWNYLLPLFNPSDAGKYVLSVWDAYPAFMGIAVLTLVPVNKKNRKASTAMFFTMIALALFYIIDVYGCYALIGIHEITHLNYPLIDAVRLIEYQPIEFFQRVDIVYMTLGFIRIFISKGIIYLAAVEYLCRMFPKIKRIVIVLVVGAVVSIASIVSLGIPDVPEVLTAITEYCSVAAAFVIPMALFVIAKVRGHGKKNA